MINPFKLRKQLKSWQMLYSKQEVKFIECKCKFAEVLAENDQLQAEIKALKNQAHRAEMIARQQSALLDMAEKQFKKLRG